MAVSRNVRSLLSKRSGILLDVSLGGDPQPNSVTFKELKCSPLTVSWPLPDRSVHTAVVMHVLEFLPHERFWSWMDELHRVMRPGGTAYVTGVYGGEESIGWLSD